MITSSACRLGRLYALLQTRFSHHGNEAVLILLNININLEHYRGGFRGGPTHTVDRGPWTVVDRKELSIPNEVVDAPFARLVEGPLTQVMAFLATGPRSHHTSQACLLARSLPSIGSMTAGCIVQGVQNIHGNNNS